MKNLLYTVSILIICFLPYGNLIAQESDNLKGDQIVWYGLDFSKAQLIGSNGFSNPNDIVNSFFDRWNSLVLAEKGKYNIEKAFNKTIVTYNLEVVKARNAKVNPAKLVIDAPYRIKQEDVNSIIKSFDSDKSNSGLGCVFIVESFNKNKKRAFIWVTIFDIASKEVIHTKRMSGKVGGFGLRNYWARGIYEIFKQCKKEYKTW